MANSGMLIKTVILLPLVAGDSLLSNYKMKTFKNG